MSPEREAVLRERFSASARTGEVVSQEDVDESIRRVVEAEGYADMAADDPAIRKAALRFREMSHGLPEEESM